MKKENNKKKKKQQQKKKKIQKYEGKSYWTKTNKLKKWLS